MCCFFFFKQKTAYEMRISDWSSDVCSSDLSAIARIREVVTTASQQLAKAQEQLGQMREMNSTIGKAGQGQIGTILKSSGLDFAGEKGVLKIGRASCRERVCKYV